MRPLTHFLRSSSLNEQTLTVPSAIINYLPSSVFPERWPWKQQKKNNTFSAVEDFNSFWWHSGTQQLIGRAKQKQTRLTTMQDFSVKTKHQSLTSLACMRLVPGANRAVCHICIQCIIYYLFLVPSFASFGCPLQHVFVNFCLCYSPILFAQKLWG